MNKNIALLSAASALILAGNVNALEFKYTHEVKISDLDHNKHMNNTNYANLIFNSVENKSYNHFEINFKNECLLGNKIDIFTAKNVNEEYIVGKSNDKTFFIAYIK